jgi:hypothetical protein
VNASPAMKISTATTTTHRGTRVRDNRNMFD